MEAGIASENDDKHIYAHLRVAQKKSSVELAPICTHSGGENQGKI